MRRMISLSIALLVVGAVSAQQDPEAIAKALYESANKTVQVLAGIKDKEGAQNAKAELLKSFDETNRIEKAFREIPAEAKKKLEETWRPKFEGLRESFKKEADRIRNDAAIYKVLADTGPFKALDDAKVARAKLQASQIAQALQAYKLAKDKYPETLEELEKGEKPFVEKGTLKDPWGKSFQFNPEGPKNKGLRPDVWTVDPVGKTIGNWLDRP